MKKLCRGKKSDGCAPNRSRAKSGQYTDSGKNIPYYNVKAHRAVLVIEMLLIAAIMIFCFSILVGAIEMSYAEWESLWSRAGDDGKLNLGVLPDFLGGMSGILAGFLLEWSIFEKIKNLSKYETIIVCLDIELTNVRESIKNSAYAKCRRILFDDIISSMENNSIIYNLPGWIKSRDRKGKLILEELQVIYGNIINRNIAIEEMKLLSRSLEISIEEKELNNKLEELVELEELKKELEELVELKELKGEVVSYNDGIVTKIEKFIFYSKKLRKNSD